MKKDLKSPSVLFQTMVIVTVMLPTAVLFGAWIFLLVVQLTSSSIHEGSLGHFAMLLTVYLSMLVGGINLIGLVAIGVAKWLRVTAAPSGALLCICVSVLLVGLAMSVLKAFVS